MFPQMGWQHGEGFSQARSSGGVLQICDRLRTVRRYSRRWSLACDTPNINGSIVMKIIVRSDQNITGSIFKADTVAVIYTIKALDSSYDPLGCVFQVHQDSERDSSPSFGTAIKQQFKAYRLWRVLLRRWDLFFGQKIGNVHLARGIMYGGRYRSECRATIQGPIAANYDESRSIRARRVKIDVKMVSSYLIHISDVVPGLCSGSVA